AGHWGEKAMPGNISFYYAIFKKLQAATDVMYAYDQEHFYPDENDSELGGGFSLAAADSPYGVFGALSAPAPGYPGYTLQQGWLGIEWEPRRIRPGQRFAVLSLMHYRPDGAIGGGFTLQPMLEQGR